MLACVVKSGAGGGGNQGAASVREHLPRRRILGLMTILCSLANDIFSFKCSF